MKWKIYAGEITHPQRIAGNPSGKRRRGLTWRPIRWISDVFFQEDAVVVDVEAANARAGYRLGLRQGEEETLIGDEVMNLTQFMVIIGPRPWLLFLVDKNGIGVPCRVSPRGNKADPEFTRIWIV